MTFKKFVSSKIHNVSVTDKSVEYHGSVGIGKDLLQEAGIQEYEKVDIINLSNGARWSTYAIAIENGKFSLNGGGARLGELKDKCVILTYIQSEKFIPTKVVFCDFKNKNIITKKFEYKQ